MDILLVIASEQQVVFCPVKMEKGLDNPINTNPDRFCYKMQQSPTAAKCFDKISSTKHYIQTTHFTYSTRTNLQSPISYTYLQS